jgi:4-diphosphocytidyl-2C-methyl-D-erythritol kinase
MTETEARLNSHEAVCAERYAQINARLKRLEQVMMTVAGTLLAGMGSVMWTFLNVPR